MLQCMSILLRQYPNQFFLEQFSKIPVTMMQAIHPLQPPQQQLGFSLAAASVLSSLGRGPAGVGSVSLLLQIYCRPICTFSLRVHFLVSFLQQRLKCYYYFLSLFEKRLRLVVINVQAQQMLPTTSVIFPCR